MSTHFSLAELTRSATATAHGIDNSPTAEALPNLYRLMELLEQVRHLLGDKPVTITSGYRCPELNRLVGGAATSAHQQGLAADFLCPAFGSVTDIVHFLPASGLHFDQLIEERSGGKSWVHIGLAVSGYRREVLLYEDGQYRRLQ